MGNLKSGWSYFFLYVGDDVCSLKIKIILTESSVTSVSYMLAKLMKQYWAEKLRLSLETFTESAFLYSVSQRIR